MIAITRKGRWQVVGGLPHNSLEESLEDAANVSASTGKPVTITPPDGYEVTVSPPPVVKPPVVDPPAPPAPSAQLQAAFTGRVEGATVHLTDLTTGAVKEQWAWGDGGTSVVMGDQDKTYRKAGTYTIGLIAWDSSGKTSKASASVTTAADSDPAAPPPASPPSDGPPAPAPPPAPPAPSEPTTVPRTKGAHTVGISSVVDGKRYVVNTYVDDDPKADGQFLALRDVDGKAHPSLRAFIYADCCDVGAVNGRDQYDYHGSLAVTYDGAAVFNEPAVEFWRGALNQTIRYGANQPAWSPVDRTLWPKFAVPDAPLKLLDLSKYKFGYNDMGVSTYTAMGAVGMRPDIAYAAGWDVPLIVQPSDAAYAVVRKATDHAGCWPIYFIDDASGKPFDITVYPATSFLPYIQVKFPGNPIAQYGDTPSWAISGSPYKWDCAHATAYNVVAANATGSARDRFHVGVWANAVLTASNSAQRQKSGVWAGYQERASAWSIRALFLASYLSDRPEYFAARLDEQRVQGERQLVHPLGFQATYVTRGFSDGGKGAAPWEENYTRLVVSVVARKLPAWSVIRDQLKKWLTGIMATPQWQLCTLYGMALQNDAGAPLTTWDDVFRLSLPPDPGNPSPPWPREDVQALLQPRITVAQVSAMLRKNQPGWPGKDGDFSAMYPTSCQDYGAIHMAAVASMCGRGAEWDLCQSTPTQPNWATGWQWNVVP